MNKLTIRVTQANIDNGIRAKCGLCPIALALRDAGFEEPTVGSYEFQATQGCSYLNYGLPESARDFINHFDAGHTVSPFEFEAVQ